MKKTEIKKRIKEALAGKVRIKKDGTVVAKRHYFYTMGMTSEKWLEVVLNKLKPLGFTIGHTEYENHWNAWPKDSWFEARVKIKELSE